MCLRAEVHNVAGGFCLERMCSFKQLGKNFEAPFPPHLLHKAQCNIYKDPSQILKQPIPKVWSSLNESCISHWKALILQNIPESRHKPCAPTGHHVLDCTVYSINSWVGARYNLSKFLLQAVVVWAIVVRFIGVWIIVLPSVIEKICEDLQAQVSSPWSLQHGSIVLNPSSSRIHLTELEYKSAIRCRKCLHP